MILRRLPHVFSTQCIGSANQSYKRFCSRFAISEVLEQIYCTLAGLSPKAGILFTAIDFDHTLVLHRIVEAFPEIVLIGGTTDGEMSSILGFEQDALTFMVLCSDNFTITTDWGSDRRSWEFNILIK
jgi:hypothetical protein